MFNLEAALLKAWALWCELMELKQANIVCDSHTSYNVIHCTKFRLTVWQAASPSYKRRLIGHKEHHVLSGTCGRQATNWADGEDAEQRNSLQKV